ncbi:unnamed protein product [Moneuplotes crassus]|uniref:Uncharacterized protein n=1 Tax=Euplotes crassus TaxID=5936 RepID=A0AAD1Y048_EUPCR|nr:unnamed protein product [Moneuplotes crassus]
MGEEKRGLRGCGGLVFWGCKSRVVPSEDFGMSIKKISLACGEVLMKKCACCIRDFYNVWVCHFSYFFIIVLHIVLFYHSWM